MSMFGKKGSVRKGPKENPSFSRVLSLPNLSQLPLILQSPSPISFPFLSLYVLPLIFSHSLSLSLRTSLAAHFSLSQFFSLFRTSEQPATHSACN